MTKYTIGTTHDTFGTSGQREHVGTLASARATADQIAAARGRQRDGAQSTNLTAAAEEMAHVPTAEGRAAFVAWLAGAMRNGDLYAAETADELIARHDWSASDRIEVSSLDTRSRHAEEYIFPDTHLRPVKGWQD